MSDPAQSLFCGGVELQLDTLDQQEREEEEEEREEAARLDAQLAQKLEGAFDDLDFDDDDSSLCSPPGAIRNQDHGAMVTPGAGVQLKYLTSTPYGQGEQEMYGNMEVQQHHQPTTPYHNFQQLPVEETNFETPFVGRNYDAFGEDVRSNHDRFGEDLNKSDSEKVLAKKLGVVTFKNDDIDILFKARGKEIDRLEKELSDRKSEFDCELRQIRHQLALCRAENQNQVGNSDQMQRVLSDARRENKIVTEEVHELNAKLKSLSMENEKLLAESERSAAVVGQLQTQLTQLQSSDTVLKARQQHDATVRSLLERHKGEMSSLREEMDHANTRAIRLEQEKTVLHEKLSFAVAGQEMAVKARVEEVAELSSKLTTAIRNNQTGQLKEEVVRVKAELSVEQREREREMGERRRLEGEVEQLRVEIGALEALQGGHSDSMVQLGLSGAEGGVGGGSQRVREELHRSLVGNRTKRGEISRLESSLRSREGELEQLRGREGELVRQVEQLGREVKLLRENMKESEENFTANKEKLEELEMLKKEIEELEKQNIELKKHVSEIVEDNDTEKQEAIDELREEYEEQVKEAVEETKALMDGELKRLRIELEVYSKTLLEIRNNYTILGEENTGLLGKVKELKGQIELKERKITELKEIHVQDAQVEKSQTKIETLREDLKKDLEKEIYDKKEEELETARKEVKHVMDEQFDQKLLKVKKELREVWEMEAKLKAEEAVATARLEWIKRLPETEKKGGAARESLGELERVRELLVRERGLREKAEIGTNERDIEIQRLVEREKELLRELGEGRREGMREAEERLGKEMRETLMKQQQQWEKIVRSGREEAEEQRRQLVEQWESQVEQVESKLRNVVDEKMGLVSREREIGTMVEQWKRTADERSSVIERLRESEKRKGEELERRSKELHLLREEAERRGQEVQRQREEMSSMVNKWRMEMEGIQASHIKERKELEEVTAKYHQLKSKVRRYQKHVDAKEEHYKAEYARLEKEFRNTLEKLRERMEAAYSVKEQQVENELGNMREQLSTELRKVVSRSQGEQDLVAKREVGDYMEQLSNRVEQRLAELDQRFDQPVKLSSMDGGHQHGDSAGRRRM